MGETKDEYAITCTSDPMMEQTASRDATVIQKYDNGGASETMLEQNAAKGPTVIQKMLPTVGKFYYTGDNLDSKQEKTVIIAVTVALVTCLIIAISLGIALQGSKSPNRGFRAIPGTDIFFNPKDRSTYSSYVDILNKTLEPYRVRNGGQVTCNESTVLKDDQICNFDADWLDKCTKEDFGFKARHPCILMTYKDDPSFVPDVYTSLEDVPSNAPENLKQSIRSAYYNNEEKFVEAVWVHCTNAYTFFPSRGMEKYYFPNKELDIYLPPLVGVLFHFDENEKEKKVDCSLWSKTNDERPPRPSLSFTIRMQIQVA